MKKKGSKPLIVSTVFISTVCALLVLAYVGLKLECEVLSRQKVLAEEKLNSLNNYKVSLIAQKQFFGSEDRIVLIASEELGMIKDSDHFLILNVDKNKIDKIKKILIDKYE